MKSFKSIWSITLQNFRKWKKDYRIWISFIFAAIFINSYTKELSTFCNYVNIKSSPWIYPFLYMQYYTKILFFFPLLLIFSNAPFIDTNQLYVISRSGRFKWCIGQLLYIVISSGLYFIFVFVFSIILNINCIDFTEEWGKVMNTLANTDSSLKFNIGFTPDKNVISLFSPIQAVWFTLLHSWISGTILGMTIFLFNMMFKGSGTFVSSFILVFSAIASKDISLTRYSPVTWSTLNYIHLHRNDNLPDYSYVISYYSVVVMLLITAILLFSRKYNYDKDFKV